MKYGIQFQRVGSMILNYHVAHPSQIKMEVPSNSLGLYSQCYCKSSLKLLIQSVLL